MPIQFTQNGENFLIGSERDDTLAGNATDETILALTGDDTIIGEAGIDRIFTGAGADTIVYNASSFNEGPDNIFDFNIEEDTFALDVADFGVNESFSFANTLASELPADGANVIVLQDTDNDDNAATVFNARSAAQLIGEALEEDGAGFFVYFNSALQVNRLVFSENLNDGDAALTILAADQSVSGEDAAAALPLFSADNFAFLGETIAGTRQGDELSGAGGDDIIRGGAGADDINGEGGDDVLRGNRGSDTISGNDGEDDLGGNGGADHLSGGDGNDLLRGGQGDDTLDGGNGVDELRGGIGDDSFLFTGDPFRGTDVSEPGRQIVGGEDTIGDFSFADDTFLLDVADDAFAVDGNASFQSLDANDDGAAINDGANVIVLLNADNDGDAATPFLAGTAANQIAELTDTDGAGFFVYFNSNLEVNRLVYSENLNDASADLSIVARLDNAVGDAAIDALSNFGANNFTFFDDSIA